MAQATLREMAREIVLYSGGACPILLAERWIRDRYRKALEKAMWSFKVGQGQFDTPAVYKTGTVTMTDGSAVVTGSGTTWTSGMATRQFKVGGFVYTISTFTSVTSVTLDRNWEKATTAALSYEILQAYITPAESNFHAFYSVIDPDNGWKLHLGWNALELDRMDTKRTSSSTPIVLAGRLPDSSDKQMYELWPHPTTQKQYPYMYEKRLVDLSASGDTPPKIMRSDILVQGALADLARWPGTVSMKNPFYDPYFNQWKSREAEFNAELSKVMVEDQSLLMTDLSSYNEMRLAPLDSTYMQNHAFPSY